MPLLPRLRSSQNKTDHICFGHFSKVDPVPPAAPEKASNSLPIHIGNALLKLTLFNPGGGRFAPTITYLCIRGCVCAYTCKFFLTFRHFDCGIGYNTFDLKKNHRFPRNYKSWSNLPNFHKGGPLRTSQSLWKSHFFRPLVGVVLGIQKL